MREGPLHAALKTWLAQPGDQLEVPVQRYVVDLVRADGELVEVQTGNFSAMAGKLDALLDEHRIRIVHPIAAERRIVRVGDGGEVVSVRRSPRRAGVVDVFDQLVFFPSLLSHPHLVVELLLIREDHVRAVSPVRVRGRTRDPGERRLVEVLERIELRDRHDLLAVLPPLPTAPFSTRDLAALLGCAPGLARRAAYGLRSAELIEAAGRRGRTPLHRVCRPTPGATRTPALASPA